MSRGGRNVNGNLNAVFYAEAYHPIQAGSIDGTDTLPHDNAAYGAFLCASMTPLGDPKHLGDPFFTLFVGHLSHNRTHSSQGYEQVWSGQNLRLVRHIVTGASGGYAFVEYETEREMQRAYKASNPRMTSWRDLGSHLHQKEDTCHPIRKRSSMDREQSSHKWSVEREANMCKSCPVEKEERFYKRSIDPEGSSVRSSTETEHYHHRSSVDGAERCHRSSRDWDGRSHRKFSRDRDEHSHKRS